MSNGLTEEIPWQAGEMVMIDNTKLWRGRIAFSDDQRQLFILLNYLNF